MKKKLIKIYLSNINAPIKELKSYLEVKEEINKKSKLIHTNCTNFFSFNLLDKGYDVVVLQSNGSYVLLSELLLNKKDHVYVNREIRKAHNVEKMLICDLFTFKNNIKEKINNF